MYVNLCFPVSDVNNTKGEREGDQIVFLCYYSSEHIPLD